VPAASESDDGIVTRLEATRLIVAIAGDAPIVASLGHPAYDLFAAGDRPQNFYTWGSMGLASSIGLGLALARPDMRVLVLDGDGSLLMNLGSLATIGLLRPANLVVAVMDNQEYATTGGQPTPTAHGADLDAAARAMGIAATATVRTESELRAAVGHGARGFQPSDAPGSPERLALQEGPVLIVAKVTESAPTAKPPLDCVFIKQRFMSAIGNPEPATAGRPLTDPPA
jgi:thiamine pyrophosphate-dependent acetolactate synthase large subunit-like protein